ncbi:hypothetical protein HPP92_013106 [Vanilla planifolia]|uniref:Thioredoxin domain-containing protein n=1 Tax=Vanilla planifolia TaxID=51239 RepID=A0A835QTY3_VANPL|nr:hypothetical protein HPP92_013106 [Vanilla planifolia]
MEAGIRRARFGFALIVCGLVYAAAGAPAACRRPSVGEWILGVSNGWCTLDDRAAEERFLGVIEGDESALQRAVSVVHRNREQYVAMLFYASWCPFSQICQPNFYNMLSLYPTIPHFAFEESAIRPSILSRYGVHGFPTLFLLNSSMRVRYHGSRSFNSLTAFYCDVTGIKPVPVNPTITNGSLSPINFTKVAGDTQENCPFSWARSPENLLQQDTYLALASSFVLLRLLYFLLPKLRSRLKRAWRWHMQLPSLICLCDYSQAFLQQAKRGFGRLNPCKRSNLQEGALSAKAWASKSLASVSIGEPSSVRSQSSFS